MPVKIRGNTVIVTGELAEAIEKEAKAEGIKPEDLMLRALERYIYNEAYKRMTQ